MTDVRGARITHMLDDPDLGGDLLLVGLAHARFIDFGLPAGKKLSTRLVADAAFPNDRRRGRRVKRILADDARTYNPPIPPWPTYRECTAPMVRRDGTCGRGTSTSGHITDWDTGEAIWIAACARHRDWFHATVRANREAEPQRRPLPPANHGGRLARHFPEIAWPKVWAWATDGRWIEHPERKPWKPPTLTLHLGDGDDTAGPRALLAPVGAM